MFQRHMLHLSASLTALKMEAVIKDITSSVPVFYENGIIMDQITKYVMIRI